MEYVYLVASLPRLELTGTPPFSSEQLLFSCGGVLRDDHRDDLRAIVEGRPEDARAPEARRLVSEETQLRGALARLRAQRAGADYAPAHRGVPSDTRALAAAARAMAIDDPLEREMALDRHRWGLLEEAATQAGFGVLAVFAYAFRLRLVERWAALSDEAGLATVAEVVDANLAGISL